MSLKTSSFMASVKYRNALRRLRVISRTLSNNAATPRIRVEPPDALIDESVSIDVSGLQKGQKVTLSAILKNDGKEFLSCAHYIADLHGRVNCTVQSSEGGSFTGIEPMGLFWAMTPSLKHRRATRLLKKDVTTPYSVTISVLPDHIDILCIQSHLEASVPKCLASTQITRWYMGKGVQRIPVLEGQLRGALFIPKGDGLFPAVLDMFGGAGGLYDFRAALLASRGFLTLSLAYFNYEGLPDHVNKLDIQYFLEAAEWLSQHPKATPGGIGVIGTSYGGGVSYLLAAHSPRVRAVIAINGAPFSMLPDQHLNGELIEGYIPIKTEVTEDGFATLSFAFKDRDIKMVPIWRRNVKILSIIGEEDETIDPQYHRFLMSEVPLEKRDNIQVIFYPGAGHIIEPPYTPHCPASYVGLQWNVCLWHGGEPKSHATAQEDAWRRILEHFNNCIREK